jgi:starvation-inducible DNA-binding protein
VAERAVALGVPPDGQPGTVAATSEIEPLVAGPLPGGDVVKAIAERLAQVVVRTRERIHHAHASDSVTEDLLVQTAAWMLRVQREAT